MTVGIPPPPSPYISNFFDSFNCEIDVASMGPPLTKKSGKFVRDFPF
ncbi:hypothetical protein GWI33_010327, partial [Rhynchophorus ferrugineus]